jgi:hypothetical protein
MKYTFHIVDVFSSTPFGNQLAVLPDAAGISTDGMQKIAREFNFAETTFVLPKNDPANTCRVRIFTPRAELDFAGHPTIGTACALVMKQHVRLSDPIRLVLEENVGPVTVDVAQRNGRFCARGRPSIGLRSIGPPGLSALAAQQPISQAARFMCRRLRSSRKPPAKLQWRRPWTSGTPCECLVSPRECRGCGSRLGRIARVVDHAFVRHHKGRAICRNWFLQLGWIRWRPTLLLFRGSPRSW